MDKLKEMSLILILLNFIDYILTIFGVKYYNMREINPFMKPFFQPDVHFLIPFIVKMGIIILLVLYILKRGQNEKNIRTGRITLASLNLIMILVIIWNIHWLLN